MTYQPRIGFHAPHELFSPSELLVHARRAGERGFALAMCSDHLHPWLPAQGHSGFAWSWLGAALEATSMSFGTVCAPGQRYHPAVIAQASATLGTMYPGRFWLALGTGEALNEAVTAAPWPDKVTRRRRLVESVNALRALFQGCEVSVAGDIRMSAARVYDVPQPAPPLYGAALSEETAAWVGEWADGMITVAAEPERLRCRIAAFERGGGKGKPVLVQALVSYDRSAEQARAAAVARWPIAALSRGALANLPTPACFERAVRGIDTERITAAIRVSADLDVHVRHLRQDFDAGATRVYLQQVGSDMPTFIDDFAAEVLPAFERRRMPLEAARA